MVIIFFHHFFAHLFIQSKTFQVFSFIEFHRSLEDLLNFQTTLSILSCSGKDNVKN